MAGSATITAKQITVLNNFPRKVLSIAVVAGEDGAFTDSTINATTYGIHGWFFHSVEVIPGDPAPNSGFNITLKNENGVDLTQGMLALLSNLETKMQALQSYGPPMIRGNLTLGISDMGVTSCKVTLILTLTAN